MNKVLHFEQTNSMSDVDDGAETEAFDTSGSSSDELEPDTTTRKLLEDFPIVEEDSDSDSDSKPKNVFSDNQVATFVFFLSVAKLLCSVLQIGCVYS